MPEGQCPLVMLEPVGQIDSATAEKFGDHAAQGSVYVTLARDWETFFGLSMRKKYLHCQLDSGTDYVLLLLQFVSLNSLPRQLETAKFFSILVKLAGKAIQVK